MLSTLIVHIIIQRFFIQLLEYKQKFLIPRTESVNNWLDPSVFKVSQSKYVNKNIQTFWNSIMVHFMIFCLTPKSTVIIYFAMKPLLDLVRSLLKKLLLTDMSILTLTVLGGHVLTCILMWWLYCQSTCSYIEKRYVFIFTKYIY